jgi:hypothetical protein
MVAAMRRFLAGLSLAPALALAAVSGCSDPPLDCVADTDLDLACSPLYPPTFDNAYANTFMPKCGTGGSSCHATEGHQAGLVLDDPDVAYADLLAASTVDPMMMRVTPGDPACSIVIERIFSTASRWHMPRGSNLSAGERCALVQWVAAGALRTPPDAQLPDAGAGAADAGVDAP